MTSWNLRRVGKSKGAASPPGAWTPISDDLNRGLALKQTLKLTPKPRGLEEVKTAGDWFTGENIFSKEFLKTTVAQAEKARLEAHGGHVYGYLTNPAMTVKPLGQDATGGALPVSVYERGATTAAQ
jgi:hypothetical protein